MWHQSTRSGVHVRGVAVVVAAGWLLGACSSEAEPSLATAAGSSGSGAGTTSPGAAPEATPPETTAPPMASAGPDRPAPAPGAPALGEGADHRAVDALHALGVHHQVADYRLQMDSFSADATAEVLAANSFNSPPSEGAYALATWTVTYTGTAEGTPWLELHTAVMGADGVQYDHSACPAVVEDGLMSQARVLNPGGTMTFATCYDAPASALAGATAVRAGTLARTDRVDWSTRP